MIIAVTQLKGGVGKSTIAVAVAAELAARGANVLVADADPQRSVQGWASLAAETGQLVPTTIGIGSGFHKPEQLPKLARSADWTVIDCPPHNGQLLRASLAIADLALLPSQAGPFDAWALGETIDLITEARRLRPALRAAVVLNRIAVSTNLGASAREALVDCGIPILRSSFGQRVAFGEAIATGMGPAQYAPQSKAAEETRALVDELVEVIADIKRKAA